MNKNNGLLDRGGTRHSPERARADRAAGGKRVIHPEVGFPQPQPRLPRPIHWGVTQPGEAPQQG